MKTYCFAYGEDMIFDEDYVKEMVFDAATLYLREIQASQQTTV